MYHLDSRLSRQTTRSPLPSAIQHCIFLGILFLHYSLMILISGERVEGIVRYPMRRSLIHRCVRCVRGVIRRSGGHIILISLSSSQQYLQETRQEQHCTGHCARLQLPSLELFSCQTAFLSKSYGRPCPAEDKIPITLIKTILTTHTESLVCLRSEVPRVRE